MINRREFLTQAVATSAVSALTPGASRNAMAARRKAQPAGAMQRKTSFDEGWSFTRGNPAGAQMPHFETSTWTRVDLPHDWSVGGPYREDASSGGPGGYVPTGFGWYRKSFTMDRGLGERRVRLLFDGIYQRSEVWINGHSLGMRPYGYIGFSYDVTAYLHAGGEPNVVAVSVDNSLQPNSRWYTGSGIYRHAWMVVTEPLHLGQWGTAIESVIKTAGEVEVAVSTRIENEGAASVHCTLTTEVVDESGKVVGTEKTTAEIPAQGEHLFEQRSSMSSPALWSPETPHLYHLRQTVEGDGRKVDEGTTPFGVREARFDADRGFLLNGRHVKLNGVCLHGDGGAVGTAVPERVWERRLTLLKEMGCNAIRCSHNPPAPEFLDMCDEMGFLVMAEAFDEWREGKSQTPQFGYHKYFDAWWKRDLTDMVARDRNHPSIVIWSAGNEIPDQLVPRGIETCRMVVGQLHSADPTRMVTAACDHVYSEPESTPPEFLALLDVVGYNYVDRWRDRREKYYSLDRHAYPQRRMVGTESVALGGARGVYGNGANPWGGRGSNMRIAVEQLQRFVQTYDYVSGDFIWTGIDYLGEGRWPAKGSSAGAIDTCGFPKDSYFLYQSLWSAAPVLHLSPHWNWAGREGEVVPVICYTNCDTVELFLNGKSLGVKGYTFPQFGMEGDYNKYTPRSRELDTTGDLHLQWDAVYQPGTLRAEGRKEGKVVQTTEVQTTGEPAAIRLTADRALISTSRGDVAHVTVEVVDAKGLMVPTADVEITFGVAGAGRILGLDNGKQDSHESYLANQRSTFNGLALVLLQSDGRPGTMQLTASAASLRSAEVRVTAH